MNDRRQNSCSLDVLKGFLQTVKRNLLILFLVAALLLTGCAETASASVPGPAPEPAAQTDAPAAKAVASGTPAPTETPVPETPAPTEAPSAKRYISEAEASLESGETEETFASALTSYLSALELEPSNVEALLGAADIFIRQGDFDGALTFLKEHSESGSDQAVLTKISELETGNISDSLGRIRKATGDGQNGNAPYVHLYDYDDQGRLVRVTWYDGEGVERDHVDVTYDAEGKTLTRADMVLSGPLAGALIHTEIGYNEQGQFVLAKYTLPGEWEEETRYFYDDAGHGVRWETYSNGELATTDVFEDFDEHGNARKRSTYAGKDQLIEMKLIEYDYEAFTRKSTEYDGSGVMRSWRVETFLPDWKTITDSVSYNTDGSVRSEYHAEVETENRAAP